MRLKTQAMLENNTEAFKLINLLNTITRWWEMEALRTPDLVLTSVLEAIFNEMRYINLCSTYLLT